MIDPQLLRHQTEETVAKLAQRGEKIALSEVSDLLKRFTECDQHVEQLRQQRNTISKQIGALKSKQQDTKDLQQQAVLISQQLKELADLDTDLKQQWRDLILSLPNIPQDDVPEGLKEEHNIVLACYDANGEQQANDWRPDHNQSDQTHLEVGHRLGTLHMQLGTKIAGTNFAVLSGKLALLNRALVSFMLDQHLANGYELYDVPVMVLPESLLSSGQLPKFSEQLFKTHDVQYLSPTAEVQLINLFSDQIINEADLPLKVTAHTQCFRREAGSYGREVSGLIRMHQFEKVEMVQIVKPEDSNAALTEILGHASQILSALRIPYRVMDLCAGELGTASSKTYDLEVWLPGLNMWREISSCSNCSDYQARRAGIRYSDTKNKNTLLHTLNGSGLALSRTLVAVLENYQTDKGLMVPEVLTEKLGFDFIAFQE